MLIEELLRTCANRQVAEAAVVSLGRTFSGEVGKAAEAHDMTRGEFTAQAVMRFARDGDEAQMRSTVSTMRGSQQPVLDGLRHILRIALDAETIMNDRQLGCDTSQDFRTRVILGLF